MRSKTAEEKRHLGRVVALGCAICGKPAQAHHIRYGVGLSQRSSHWLTVPLCPDHHLGDDSIHRDPRGFESRHKHELELLAWVIKMLCGDVLDELL